MDLVGLAHGPIEGVELLAGGTQNILVRFRRAGETFVLRRPPLHKRASSDETMRREARVLGALAGSDVPHPRLVAACPDDDVLGAAFYLMESVDGVNVTLGLPAAFRSRRDWRHALGIALATTAARIGNVDHEAVGLGDLGVVDGYLARQVQRWRAHFDGYRSLPGYPGGELPGFDGVAAWLEANLPSTWQPGLVHGDFHFANVLVGTDRPAVAAVVDWELTTVGDPLLDLGWLLATWPGEDGAPLESLRLDPWDGFPTAAELVDAYAAHSARPLDALLWYEVLACFKLGILLEGTHARACAGLAPRETGDALHTATLRLFARALDRVR